MGLRQANWEMEVKLSWRQASPPNHHDDQVDSDQYAINKEVSLWGREMLPGGLHRARRVLNTRLFTEDAGVPRS